MLILDGAYATNIQEGYSSQELRSLYLEAGASLVSMNFFDLSLHNFNNTVKRLLYEAHSCDSLRGKLYCNLGPTDVSLTISPDRYDDVYSAYSTAVGIAKDYTNIFYLETQTDLRNIKCAISAILSKVDTPEIWVSVSPDDGGFLMSGQSLRTVHDSLCLFPSVKAFGVNCVSPDYGLKLVSDLSKYSCLYIIYKPNAGLPSNGVYSSYDFTSLDLSGKVNIVGGCCGTSPRDIKAFSLMHLRDFTPLKYENPVKIINEKFNANGSKKFREACLSGDLSTLQDLLVGDWDAVDINLDHHLLLSSRKEIYSRVISLPQVQDKWVSIDSFDDEFVDWALRVTPNPCIVNSVSCERGELVLSSRVYEISRFGGVPIIRNEGFKVDSYAFSKIVALDGFCRYWFYDPCFKPLGLSYSLSDSHPQNNWCPGLSNISYAFKFNKNFRKHLNVAVFNSLGLKTAICNPLDFVGIDSLLLNTICSNISDYSSLNNICESTSSEVPVILREKTIVGALVSGDVSYLLNFRIEDLLNAFEDLGALYDGNKVGVLSIISASNTLKSLLPKSGDSCAEVALMTIESDIHDIGKDITIGVLEGSGISVDNLGVDVPYYSLKEAALKYKIIGISALITPSLIKIKEHLSHLDSEGINAVICLGGAVVDDSFVSLLSEILTNVRVSYTKTPADTVQFVKNNLLCYKKL